MAERACQEGQEEKAPPSSRRFMPLKCQCCLAHFCLPPPGRWCVARVYLLCVGKSGGQCFAVEVCDLLRPARPPPMPEAEGQESGSSGREAAGGVSEGVWLACGMCVQVQRVKGGVCGAVWYVCVEGVCVVWCVWCGVSIRRPNRQSQYEPTTDGGPQPEPPTAPAACHVISARPPPRYQCNMMSRAQSTNLRCPEEDASALFAALLLFAFQLERSSAA